MFEKIDGQKKFEVSKIQNQLRFVLPISNRVTILFENFSIILLFKFDGTRFHGAKYVKEFKRCFIKRLIT